MTSTSIERRASPQTPQYPTRPNFSAGDNMEGTLPCHDLELAPPRAVRNSSISGGRRHHSSVGSPRQSPSIASVSPNDSTHRRSSSVAPYETPVYVQTSAASPAEVHPSPPVNPDSFSGTPITPRELQPVNALPGTMTSRSKDHERSKSRNASPKASVKQTTSNRKRRTPKFGARVKLALKEIFKKYPVDEAMFERIEDEHWTDEVNNRGSLERRSARAAP